MHAHAHSYQLGLLDPKGKRTTILQNIMTLQKT